MKSPYARYADAVVRLEQQLESGNTVMPIGLDGAMVAHFLRFRMRAHGWRDYNPLPNTVHASSKTKELDRLKFNKVMSLARAWGKIVYAVDMLCESGELGIMLRSAAEEFNNQNSSSVRFFYSVLFDPNQKADIRGSDQGLKPDERKRLYWFNTSEEAARMIPKVGDVWNYSNLTNAYLNRIPNAYHIKKHIRSIPA